jgi:Na+-transporting NADH:ubiquinone oxidoreductase subunit B
MLLKRQNLMRKVILATLPCVAGAVYLYGWRSLMVLVVACVVAFLAEYLFCRWRKEPVTEAVFVTAILYALTLPPLVPFHVVVVGAAFAVVFAKEVFGGFGRNCFNPAMAGRCFVYLCFPMAMTAQWVKPAPGLLHSLQAWCVQGFRGPVDWSHALGALAMWSAAGMPDAVTTATVMGALKTSVLAGTPAVQPSLWGVVLGTYGSTLGGTSAILVIAGGIYLFVTRTANRTTILVTVATYAVLAEVLALCGVKMLGGAAHVALQAGFLLGAMYMATDPVTAAKTQKGRIVCGILLAVLTLVIRAWSIFPAGFMFALLLTNMFTPIIDYAFTPAKRPAAGGPA